MKGCLQALGTSNAQDIVFSSIRTGSTVISGSGQVQSGSVTQTANSFSQTISSGIPGTSYTAGNVNIQYPGQSTTEE